MKIEIVDPDSLRLHPFLEQLPEPDSDLLTSMSIDIEERGIIAPLVVDEKSRIMDGRIRWKIAVVLELAEVPITLASSADAATIIVQSLLQRRHFSKSALAYIAFPLFEPMFEELRERRLRMLRSGGKPEHSTQSVLSGRDAETIARQAGVSRVLFFQAARVHALFKKHPETKEKFEPKILNGDLNLGYAINGIEGFLATKGKSRRENEQLLLFQSVFHAAAVRFANRWQNLGAAARNRVIAQFTTELLPALPPEIHAAYQRFIKTQKAGVAK